MLQVSVVIALSLGLMQSEPTAQGDSIEPAATPEQTVFSDLEPSIEELDIAPSVPIVKTADSEVRLGGLVQAHAAPYVGEDSLIENGDPASTAGFRLRRARIGAQARFKDRLGLFLAVNPLETDREVGAVADAQITYEFAEWLRLQAGTSKVPFSRGALVSSRTLPMLERPLTVAAIVPSRRLGVTAEGSFVDGKVGYLVAVMNGTEGYSRGNLNGGVLLAGRVEGGLGEVNPFRASARGVRVGLNALSENGPAINAIGYGADVVAGGFGGTVQLEVLCDNRKPQLQPTIAPTLSVATRRCGAYVEATYVFPVPRVPLQLAVRAETFDDNEALQDAGDTLIFSGGLNAWFVPDFARAQLHYVARRERFSTERQNDALVLALQGSF